ncbi:MAG: hypothetical protein DMF59_05255 [Acidobacteria bacterium]|nr:MAG: hypothetical protein DMF59_05255 [Acidobacteriota bacterium]
MEGDAFSLEMAGKHASGCQACAAKLASWNEISTVAQGMQTTWQKALDPRREATRAIEVVADRGRGRHVGRPGCLRVEGQ